MSNPELLAKLAPQCTKYGEASGGYSILDKLDNATLLTGLSKRETEMLLVMYALAPPDRLRKHFLKMILRQQWGLPPWKTMRLLDATLEEHLNGLVCDECEGVGQIMVGDKVITCSECNGTGRAHWSKRKMAKRLGLNRGKLEEPWKSKVDWCRRELRIWELEARSKLGWTNAAL